MSKKEFSVIVPESVFPKPSAREMSAAYILLDYFKTDIIFVPRSNQKKPDFLINGLHWELKTPIGTGKYNIQHLLHSAIQQSKNIIVDARYSKMRLSRIVNELKRHSTLTTKGIKNLIVITKAKKILVII
ncbi:hypothetical protein IJG71_03325 [Candidatus Saccharibacteria bacterium]|nr:hypothetical protein [Candidatus Saccharibacteria bacterium]